ncbi:MAG: rRNA maturation RNase YbeY [Hyphomicrobium sp.]|nr:rRNA maturation RNase YbeY [Hyphomicrobium sp.]
MPDDCDSSVESASPQQGSAGWLAVDILHEDGEWPDFEALALGMAAAAATLSRHAAFGDAPPSTACIALSSDATVRRLNAEYRKKDSPTNVLSFPAPDAFAGTDDDAAVTLGDIVLAEETVRSEADELGIPLSDHVRHLAVHGLLHLLGYDHEVAAEAETMEALEIEILSRLGIPDPYAGRELK